MGPARVPSLHYTSFFKDGDALSLLAPLVLAESSPTSLLVICASPVALFGACCCGVLCFLGIWIIGDLGIWGFDFTFSWFDELILNFSIYSFLMTFICMV